MGKMSELRESVPVRHYPCVALHDLEDYTKQDLSWLLELHAVPYDVTIRWVVGCSESPLYCESTYENARYIDHVLRLLGIEDGEVVLIDV